MTVCGSLPASLDTYDAAAHVARDGNGNLYFVCWAYYGSNRYEVWKSTDDGQNWSHIDSAHDKTSHAYYILEGSPSIVFDDDVIYIYYNTFVYSGSGYTYRTVYVLKFYMSHSSTTPDTWASMDVSWNVYLNQSQNGGYHVDINPSTHDFISLYTGHVQISTTWYTRIYYAKIVGTTLTTGVRVDNNSDTADLFDVQYPMVAVDNINYKYWFWWGWYSGGYNYRFRTMTSAYSLNTIRTSSGSYSHFFSYNDSGTVKMFCLTYGDYGSYCYYWTMVMTEAADGTPSGQVTWYSPPYDLITWFPAYWDTNTNQVVVWHAINNGNYYWRTLTNAGGISEVMTTSSDRQPMDYGSAMSHHSGIFAASQKRCYYIASLAYSANHYLHVCCYVNYDWYLDLASQPAPVGFDTIAPTVLWTNLVAIPKSDADRANWVDQDGGVDNLYLSIDDYVNVNNSDFIKSADNLPSSSIARFKLTTPSSPLSGKVAILKFNYSIEEANPMLSEYPARNLKVRLYQGEPPGDYNVATLSKGASVTADSDYPGYLGLIPPSAPAWVVIDEDDGTYHESARPINNTRWVKVDLGQSRTVTSMYFKVNPDCYSYRLKYSSNNSDWTTLGVFDNPGWTWTLNLAGITARYWLFEVVTCKPDDGFTMGLCFHTWAMYIGGQNNRIDICTLTYNGITSTSPVDIQRTLSTEEVALITDWSKLYVEFEASQT